MDSYYSSSPNFKKSSLKSHDEKEAINRSKHIDSSELNRSSKHIDSGVCVESNLSSVSSILTSSSSLVSNYSNRSTKQNKHSSINDSKSPLNSYSKYETTKDSLFESAELTELYEYDYDEKEDNQTEYEELSTNYDLINEKELMSKNYLLSNDDLQDKNGNTMLHLAIIENKPQLAYHIISLYPHPDYLDIRNKWSQSALHLACLTGQIELARYLIVSGSTIDLIDVNGDTSCHIACRLGDLKLIKQFFQPITKNEIIKANLSYQVSASSFNFKKFILNEKNFEGEDCIFLAAQSGNFELIEYLVLNEGAEINSQELKEGNTVLHMAVRLKSVDLIEFLIKCGAHVNKVNYANKTPLHIAWKMLNGNPNSRRIKIMIHLLKKCGGEPIDYYSSDSSDDSDSSERSNNLDNDSSTGELSD